MSRLAIIPARGGSKRLPRKNLLDFFGKPMLAWTIEAALASGVFTRVLVSTEDAEIAEMARRHGAEVPFLRVAAFDDVSPVSEATTQAVQQALTHFKEDYACVAQLMPNCPLRGAAEITEAMTAFDTAAADFQLSCVRFGWMNPWWAIERDDTGVGKPLFAEALTQRSQDLPELYAPSGAIWIARTQALLASKSFYGPGHRFEPISLLAGVDIDDADDLAFAGAAFILKSQRAQD